MGTATFRRDLANEAEKHFHGTPDERVRTAFALGASLFDMYLHTLPRGTSQAEAEDMVRRQTHRGRRPSRVMDLPRG
jgi:hypothetical protein